MRLRWRSNGGGLDGLHRMAAAQRRTAQPSFLASRGRRGTRRGRKLGEAVAVTDRTLPDPPIERSRSAADDGGAYSWHGGISASTVVECSSPDRSAAFALREEPALVGSTDTKQGSRPTVTPALSKLRARSDGGGGNRAIAIKSVVQSRPKNILRPPLRRHYWRHYLKDGS